MLSSGRLAGTVAHIAARIAEHALARGHAPALVGADGELVTFAQLHACIADASLQLARAGLLRRHRVGLLVPPGVAGGQLVMALACHAALVPINPALTGSEFADFVRSSRLDAIVFPPGFDGACLAGLLDEGTRIFQADRTQSGGFDLQLCSAPLGAVRTATEAAASDVALILRSSGTTGTPKLIPVTHGNLVAMAARLGSSLWFGLGPRDRAACILPLHYAAGLKTCLFSPLILGASVGFPPAGQAADLAVWAPLLRPTFLSVAPGLLNAIVDRLRSDAADLQPGALRFVMCAASYLPDDLRRAAQEALRVPVLEFYGLSEAGVMAANPVSAGPYRDASVGLPVPGEVLVVDDRRRPVQPGEVGEVMISGPTVMPGYLQAPAGDAGDLQGGWLLTGDLGRLDARGYLSIVGRRKEMINRGGEKVSPYEIEKAMLEHPAVREAAAFAVPHARLGESIAAAAVLHPGAAVGEHELRSFLAARLAPFKLPRRLHFLASLPRGASGKLLRGALAARCAELPAAAQAPDRLLELELRDIWARLLGARDIGIDDDFFDRGGDSLLAMKMLVEVEALTGQRYPLSELSMLTIRRMAEVLTAGLPAEEEAVTLVRGGSGVPLFLCHGDYVTRGLYAHKLAALLPPGAPVYLLNCPAQLPADASIEALAQSHLPHVTRLSAGSPVILGGYCNGGLAAWHLAHLLRGQGVEVVHLLLLETMSINAQPGMRVALRVCVAVQKLLPRQAAALLRDRWLPAAWNLRRRLGRLGPRSAWRKLRRWLGPAVGDRTRNDKFDAGDLEYLRLMARYVPPRLDVDVTCFIADEGRHFDTRPRNWRRLAPGVLSVSVPGTHLSSLVSGREALAAALAATLDESNRRHPHSQPWRVLAQSAV